jgi:hypothetical protein
MDSQLDPIATHLNLLLDSNISAEELDWFMKLFGVSPEVNLPPCGKEHKKTFEKALRKKPIKHINTSNEIGDDWKYLEPDHLSEFLIKENGSFSQKKIIHHWVEYDHTDLKTDKEKDEYKGYQRTIEYEGDSHNLVKAILQMLPPKWDNKSTSVPFTIILPYNNKFNIKEFTNEGEGWDVFNLDEKATKKLFPSTQGSITFLAILQLLGITEDAITSILRQTGSLKSTTSKNHSFQTLYHRYRDGKVDGLYLSENAKDEVLDILKGKESFYNDVKAIIPTFDFQTKYKKTLTNLRTIQGGSNKATENDMVTIRSTMSYLMSHACGVAVTVNIPINDDMKGSFYSTPTLILPKRWSIAVNAHRPSHNKDIKDFKKQMKLDYANELTDEDIMILYQEYQGAMSLLRLELPRLDGGDTAKKITTVTCKKFSRVILGAGYSKTQFPMRVFPNPAYPECYPAKK